MKDEITRMRRKKIQPGFSFHAPLYIATIENDPSLEVDFTIVDAHAVPDKGKIKSPRNFFIRINQLDTTRVIFNSRDIVYGPVPSSVNIPGGQTKAVLYQFNVSYEGFSEGNNIVTIYEEASDRNWEGEKESIGKEIDDDAAQSSLPKTPPVKLPQDDGSSLTVRKLWELSYVALPDKNEVNVKLERPGIEETTDKILWRAIKNHSLKFDDYEKFIDTIICKDMPDGSSKGFNRNNAKTRSPFIKSDEYNLIKFATEFYMLKTFGLKENELLGYVGNSGKLPYYDFVIDRIRDELIPDSLKGIRKKGDDCEVREEERLFNPFMIELIWSYWMEQGMLVQTMNVINLRFQNIRTDVYSDRLQRFDADPLRPLSYILWGYIQDEQHRLSLPRRVNEYDHEYGLILTGSAVNKLNAVDSRVKFLDAFHNLLNLAFIYFKESDDTTYIADAFPVLNALREVHLLLAEGNHNAYGNLTWTARQEMLIQQYILARPEMREFLGGRTMVPTPETWMDRVDSMRHIQSWGQTSILHYYELAIHGELVLLSIRYGNWSDVTLDRAHAANWAQEFRNNIYRYTHAYRVVTGVDLTADKIQSTSTFAIQPAYLIQQRLMADKRVGLVQQQQQRMLISRTKGTKRIDR